MRKHDEVRLRHMIEAACEAVSFAHGRARGDLDSDRQLLLSLVKDIEIVGEAAAQISESTRSELASIPWPRIVAMRNRLVHAYFSINLDIVWKTVQENCQLCSQSGRSAAIDQLERFVPPDSRHD